MDHDRYEWPDDELAGIVTDALAEHRVPGCAVAVAHEGRVWSGGFGVANVETGLPFTARTRIPICSMSKPYAAAAVLALVEEGRVDLDASVRRYLPDFRVADEAASVAVTVRQLLNHTSGWVGDLENEDRHHFDRGDDAVEKQVARMATLRQVFPPGEYWSYSNSAIVVAGRVVEAVTGVSFETFARERLLEPLGMSQSTYFHELAIAYPIAVGHDEREDGGHDVIDWPWTPERRISPAGGVISTAEDQLRWARWWAGDLDGVVDPLRAETRDRMLDETIPAGNICDAMGLGWMVDELDGARVVHHGGTGFGIQTLSFFVPGARLAGVVLANARGGLQVQPAVRDHLLASLAGIRPRPLPSFTPSRAARDEYLGRYVRTGVENDETLTVEASGDGVELVVHGERDMGPAASAAAPDAAPDSPDAAGDAPDSSVPSSRLAARFHRADELVLTDGPVRGLRAEFVRAPDGSLFGLRFGVRIWVREHAA